MTLLPIDTRTRQVSFPGDNREGEQTRGELSLMDRQICETRPGFPLAGTGLTELHKEKGNKV